MGIGKGRGGGGYGLRNPIVVFEGTYSVYDDDDWLRAGGGGLWEKRLGREVGCERD